jgi:hypothetical protein
MLGVPYVIESEMMWCRGTKERSWKDCSAEVPAHCSDEPMAVWAERQKRQHVRRSVDRSPINWTENLVKVAENRWMREANRSSWRSLGEAYAQQTVVWLMMMMIFRDVIGGKGVVDWMLGNCVL